MDDDDRELVNRLFAAATAMLEDASEVAMAGQSPGHAPTRLIEHGQRLRSAAHNIATIAEAAAIIADRADSAGRGSTKSTVE